MLVAIPVSNYTAIRRALDFAVNRMHLADQEKTQIRALSDELLLAELKATSPPSSAGTTE
jgi:hypothetical protein